MCAFNKAWNESYYRRENYLFYPHEEVIRFCAKYLKKRIDINEFESINNANRILCLGCGIGRHVFFFDEMQFEAYGIDISENAINKAREWADFLGKSYLKARFSCASGHETNFRDSFFDAIVSHGVLDSMPFDLAKKTTKEAERVLATSGYFYLDLISGDESNRAKEFAEEVIVQSKHEEGTIQSYFNFAKIQKLLEDTAFSMIECSLIRKENVFNGSFSSRYHIVLKKEPL